MGKLIVFGKELDWSKEIEICINKSGLGMNCKLTYKDGEGIKEETRHNCTEFHHRFGVGMTGIASAFESDIHGTGGTKDLSRLEAIEVEIAPELNEGYY